MDALCCSFLLNFLFVGAEVLPQQSADFEPETEAGRGGQDDQQRVDRPQPAAGMRLRRNRISPRRFGLLRLIVFAPNQT